METYTLIAVAGKTDPIRSGYDGPILHIVRHYHPRWVVILLSEEIGKDEQQYHYNETAIRMLDPSCEVVTEMTGIKKAHSYEDFAIMLSRKCEAIKDLYPEDTILLDITSGTPQLETALCMIGLSDDKRYLPVQVSTPVGKGNGAPFFNPGQDSIEQWFREDKDNEPGAEKRCYAPKLLNFKRPLLRHQIQSLIQNYDYAGALQIYKENTSLFERETGLLLEHAKKRLNLEDTDARRIAKTLGKEDVLYLISNQDAARLTEFYNSMCVKQYRGELNDFALRIEIFTEYLAIYLLEYCVGVTLDQIADKEGRKQSDAYRLNSVKCEKAFPGLSEYLNGQYNGKYSWERELNGRTMVQMVQFLCDKKEYRKYSGCADEMWKWCKITSEVRNPAAHTIIAITDEKIKAAYRSGSASLCRRMKQVLQIIFGNQVKTQAFDMYDTINQMIRDTMDK